VLDPSGGAARVVGARGERRIASVSGAPGAARARDAASEKPA
jgi:hypothetical protein